MELAPKEAAKPVEVSTATAVEKRVNVGPHLKSSDELTDFPEFPEGTKSLLSKCMTKDVWD